MRIRRLAPSFAQQYALDITGKSTLTIGILVDSNLSQNNSPVVKSTGQAQPILGSKPMIHRFHIGAGEAIESRNNPVVIADDNRFLEMLKCFLRFVARYNFAVFVLDLRCIKHALLHLETLSSADSLAELELDGVAGNVQNFLHNGIIMA